MMETVNMQQSADPPLQSRLGLYPGRQFFFLMGNIGVPEIADVLDHPWEFGIAEVGELLSDGSKDTAGRFLLTAIRQENPIFIEFLSTSDVRIHKEAFNGVVTSKGCVRPVPLPQSQDWPYTLFPVLLLSIYYHSEKLK
jgi:hypothetical protein